MTSTAQRSGASGVPALQVNTHHDASETGFVPVHPLTGGGYSVPQHGDGSFASLNSALSPTATHAVFNVVPNGNGVNLAPGDAKQSKKTGASQ